MYSHLAAHEDALGATPGCLQSELRPAIPDEVELDVAATAQLLPLLHLLSEGDVLAALEDWDVRWHEGITHVPDEGENFLRRLVVQVIEKNAADPAGLIAVLEVEVVIAPFFKLGVIFFVVLVTHGLKRLVEVYRVFLEQV
ncbi:hypothetical protein BC936DRAFT_145047 [Jimgerdemannia flammicorona]|uniref:Uncharacterized protein n=1 Tax=Jimgerdemannia flammicorona TaxID=994334 RepID=A0A433DB25_9FUNG|nr:hypothetical protein BC936DRAFT_145047 [Jimgerdemannia flammicorona]